MKHVAILAPRLGKKGGLEKYPLQLAQAFFDHQCDVTILTEGKNLAHPSIKTVGFPALSKQSFLRLSQFDRYCQEWINQNRPDIVFGMDRHSKQTHYRAGNGVHAEYLQRRNPSFFKRLSFSINPLHRTILNYEKATFESKNLIKVFTNSYMVKNEILKHYSTNPSKISVIHNGVEWEALQTSFDEAETNSTYFHFLFVGHGWQRKGLLPLITGLKKIHHRDWKLTVVGKDREQKRFEKLVQNWNLSKQITFTGPQKSVIPFFQRADCLVIPSYYDPFANVTIEALAMGLYIVTSPFNGGREVVEEGTIIESLDNPDSVLSALSEALKHPKTHKSALKARNSVKYLEFQNQLHKIVKETLYAH